MTRQRMYLETMERLFGGTDKIILDSRARRQRRRAVSAAHQLRGRSAPRRGPGTADSPQSDTGGRQPMRTQLLPAG